MGNDLGLDLFRAKQQNTNDEYFIVVEWKKNNNEMVKKGEIIAIAETTKSLFEIEADSTGYLHKIQKINAEIDFTDILYAISKEKINDYDLIKKHIEKEKTPNNELDNQDIEKKWTKKAEMLAKSANIDINSIPTTGKIQESDVKLFLESLSKGKKTNISDLIDDIYHQNRQKKVLLVGGGRGAIQVIDIINSNPNLRPVGIVDDDTSNFDKTLMGIKIIGNTEKIIELKEQNYFDELVITFSNDLQARKELYEKYKKSKIKFSNIIDNSVKIHSNVSIGEGNIIIANSRLGSCSILGNNNFLSAYTGIEHHCKVESHCTFGPSVILSSRVNIGSHVKFGTGIFIEPGISIGSSSIISSGSIITSNVPERSIFKSYQKSVIRSLDK